MMIAVVNQKGGAGKTTLLYNLAGILAERGPVSILDTDPQGSVTTAWGMRTRPDLPITVSHAPAFPLDHPTLSAPLALVDTPPGSERHTLAALGLADLALVPITPSALDLLAALPLVGMAQQARKANPRLVLLAVMNQVKAGSVIPGTVADMARDHGLKLARTSIPDTVALREATLYGLPLNFHAPRHPAVEAFRALAREVMEAIRHGKK